jgi:hypothetical protein
VRGLDAGLRARGLALPPLPATSALDERDAAGAAAREALALWTRAAYVQRPGDSALAALPLRERAEFLNSTAFVEALTLDQASCVAELYALRAAERELAQGVDASQRAALRTAIERDARALVDRTGAIASPRADEPAPLAAYRREAKAIFAERYARYALGLAQRAAAPRAGAR